MNNNNNNNNKEEVEAEADDDEDEMMKKLLGFSGFNSTKDRKHADVYVCEKKKQRQYHQYKGGNTSKESTNTSKDRKKE
ncbi:hypothetical protein MP638_004312 [Amoeboaphelidium occidentale]|nr:hypothetical protein MP638_004312 [Amoeboaphelidium occidentale]